MGELREIAALAVGIVLAARVGASYTVQLATMRGSEEIDALRVLGRDPVLPRLVALLVAAPLLTAMAAAAGMGAGWAVAVVVYDVAPREYLQHSLEAMSLSDLVVGRFKGTLYGLLVGQASCRQGLHAERSAQGVGQVATRAVVQAIVWVTVAASLSTVLFQGGALWSSMSVGDNVTPPLRLITALTPRECAAAARLKLALVGLGVPSAGLDPLSSARLDELIGHLRDGGTSVAMVPHELDSIVATADRARVPVTKQP